jgi:capsular polysaccharide biosynthesis protein
LSTVTDQRYISSLDGDGSGEEEPVYPSRMVGLRTMKEGLRRHRVFWASCAVLGVVIGAAFHLLIPAKYVAVTTLYLAQPGGMTYTVADDVNLLETSAVANRALSQLHVGTNAGRPGSYQGLAVGNILLQIKADSSTPARAVRWANTLARAFLAVRAQTLDRQTNLVVSSLQAQVKRLASDVQRLNHAIAVLSSSQAGPTTSNQVAQMVSERGTDETQLTTLQNEVQQDLLEESAVNKGSYVLDPAQALLVHTKKIFAEDGLSGLVAGLAVGVGIVVVGAIVSDRPRRRAEVADLLGAPVELSLHGLGEPGWRTAAGPRGYVKKPSAQLELAQRRLRDSLGRLQRPALALVSTGKGSLGTAAALLAGTALSLAGEGKPVVLVDLAEGRPLARLFRVRRKGGVVRPVTLRGKQLTLVVAPEDVASLDSYELTKGAGVVLVLANADVAVGAEHLRSWAEGAVVVLRAGKASDLLIEATGQVLRGAGVLPVSAILLGADKGDETSGLVEYASQGG